MDAAPVTVQEYLVFESAGEVRHEYVEGVLIPVMEVSRAHLEIQANLVATLNQALCEHACKVLTGARVFISPTRYRYPDIAVLCTDWELRGEPDNVSLVNPGLLVEVVSPRTAYADFEVKPHEYRTLPTVQEY